MDKLENRELKKVLVYLFHKCEDKIEADKERYKETSQTANLEHLENTDKVIVLNEYIAQEILEKNIQSDKRTINEFLKANNIKTTDYKAMFERKFPKWVWKINVNVPLLIIPNKWRYIDKNVC